MEPYGLHSLADLLNHRFVVRNRLAEALYGEGNVATYTRLMSRARGRHRFTEGEVHRLLVILRRLARKLDRRAAKLAALGDKELRSGAVLRLLDLPEFNAKPFIEDALGTDRYYAFYDRARARGRLPDAWRQAVVEALHAFVQEIHTGCEQAERDARQYPFSYGKGGASHLK